MGQQFRKLLNFALCSTLQKKVKMNNRLFCSPQVHPEAGGSGVCWYPAQGDGEAEEAAEDGGIPAEIAITLPLQLVVMVVVFVLCWTPYASTAVAGILGQDQV